MKRTIPLQEHPEFSIIDGYGWREFRVEAPGGRRRAASRLPSIGGLWLDACVVSGVAYCWKAATSTTPGMAVLFMVLLLYVYTRSTQIQWESVVIFPSIGIQLETHKGFAGVSLLASRKFVPWSSLEDFLINEGLRGWDVRYYCVAINRTLEGSLQLEVAFENILPRFPILLEVYHGVQEALQIEIERRTEPSV
ncbi:hypothetical protein DICSQDRAFT_49466 [Dichomitus squalens LYAD-421 SS1]|uniref:Phosphatidylinositol N-acetylglucosaminyltransferase subunit H conserved domain-containing protein n=1 Tax=Dichomitus squalens TaxID=114155 RepID=A0A4Q9QD95_9APHY|nr:uncharacterized protein DICSQDRAFT_49466 [Dichomitus squalens LYAD-421 SS1]EJF66015.1 hypothetical protein DICSQDRAFT_49466 [Dichomitus squalens LYAD-421 SS1]TBU65645.1 hypothetical protein BD310DRAFT_804177 [Dichomitus squalens]